MRKFALAAVTALALSGVVVSSALAAVEVRNSSGEVCGSEAVCEVTLGGTVGLYNGQYPVHNCYADLLVSVSGDGEILMLDGEFEGLGGSQSGCQTLGGNPVNDCGNSGWLGWILGPGDEWNGIQYTGAGEFDAAFEGCLSTAFNYSPGTQLVLRFGTDGQEWTFDTQSPFESAFPSSSLSIDFDSPSEELQITSVES